MYLLGLEYYLHRNVVVTLRGLVVRLERRLPLAEPRVDELFSLFTTATPRPTIFSKEYLTTF